MGHLNFEIYLDEFQPKNNVDPPKSLLIDTILPYWLPKQSYCMNLRVAQRSTPTKEKCIHDFY